MECMQYTIRGIPGYLDAGFRNLARAEEKSLNTVLLEALEAGMKIFKSRPKNAELLELAGSWVEDADCDAALADMNKIDEAMWK